MKARKMKKRIIYYLTLVVSLLMLNMSLSQVNASSGKLKTASIIECNGQHYGQHSSDNHYHKATKHDAGWYPQGENLGTKNPCEVVSNPTSETESPSEKQETQKTPETKVIIETPEANTTPEQKTTEEVEVVTPSDEEEKLPVELLSFSSKITNRDNDQGLPCITSVEDLELIFNQKEVKTSFQWKQDKRPFNRNTVNVTVLDQPEQIVYEIPVLVLGTNEELLALSQVSLQYDGKIYALNDEQFSLHDQNQLDVSKFQKLLVNGVNLADYGALGLQDANQKYSVSLHFGEMTYSIPLSIQEVKEDHSWIFIGIGGVVMVMAIGGLWIYYNRKIKPF